MTELGRIKWFKNGYGRVSRADGTEAFLKPGTFPRGEDIQHNDELQFEVEADPDPKRAGQFLAKNVTVVSKVPRAPAAVPPADSSPPGNVPAARNPKRATEEKPSGVSFRFGKQEVDGDLFRIPVWVKLTPPVSGVAATLHKTMAAKKGKPKTEQVLTPSRRPSTDEQGEAFFTLYLPSTVKQCDLVAKIGGKDYTSSWPPIASDLGTSPEPTPPSAPPEPTEPPQVQKAGVLKGVYTYEIKTAPKAPVTIDATIPVHARRENETDWAGLGPFTAGDDGKLRLQVEVNENGARGAISFRVKSFRSIPQFVAHRNRPQPR